MITCVMLDYGRVLAYPTTGNWFITPKTAEIISKDIFSSLMSKPNEVSIAFQNAETYLNENHLLHTEQEEITQFTQFFRLFFTHMNIDIQEVICKKLAEDLVCNDQKVTFYNDVYSGLQELKGKYRIAVLSDTWPSLRRILDNAGISSLLDALIMSCDYDETKEGTKLFEIAISQLKENPENIMFVDDSISNLANAEKAGLIPVLMDRNARNQASPYPIAKDLNDIQKLLMSM